MRQKPLFEITTFDATRHVSPTAASAATSISRCDPPQFLRLMEEIARVGNMTMRDQPYDPGPAFAEHYFGDVTWGSEQGVTRALRYFHKALEAKPGCNESNGLCATLAARGCGKSHMVDHLCRLHDKKKEDGDGGFKLRDGLNDRLVPVQVR